MFMYPILRGFNKKSSLKNKRTVVRLDLLRRSKLFFCSAGQHGSVAQFYPARSDNVAIYARITPVGAIELFTWGAERKLMNFVNK